MQMSEAVAKARAEMQAAVDKAAEGAETNRGFLEEVVRAEIRGRMQVLSLILPRTLWSCYTRC